VKRQVADAAGFAVAQDEGPYDGSVLSSKDDPFDVLHRANHLRFDVLAIAAVLAAVTIFIFCSASATTPIPVWRSCQIGGLECLEAVFFDQRYELIAIFVIAFCLFLWIIHPKAQRSMELWHGRQAPDAVCQMRQVVGEEGRKKLKWDLVGYLCTEVCGNYVYFMHVALV
jgi:hypothetical protein